MNSGAAAWPEGKRFAFTVFDDPDSQTLEDSRVLYGFLRDLGFRTTIGVWPVGAYRVGRSRSETCQNPAYREHMQEMQRAGFEIGFHGANMVTSKREVTLEGMDKFREYFGAYPTTMSNHFDNGEAIYWGPKRLSGLARLFYSLSTIHKRRADRYFGEVEGAPEYWGDLCHERIEFCRNFVYRDINTLAQCPLMPYQDPARPLVRKWYASSEGAEGPLFMGAIAEAHQDRLEEQGGACIMYTHFGKGFVEDGKLVPRFRELMQRLAKKNGWFVPVSTLLRHLESQRGLHTLTASERRELEWKWLREKFTRGTA